MRATVGIGMWNVLARVALLASTISVAVGGCGDDRGAPTDCPMHCPWGLTFAECKDGDAHVHGYLDSITPCEEHCPQFDSQATCSHGCRIDLDSFSQADIESEIRGLCSHYATNCADWFCEENRPKSPGDPCESDDDCQPVDYDEPELVCDLESGVCLEP